MSGTGILAASSIVAVIAVLILRLSWGKPQRSTVHNAVGWAMLAAAFIGGWMSAGAWGATVASLWTISAAMVVLGLAAWRSPPARRKTSNRRAGMLPDSGQPTQIGRRIGTFLIVTIVTMTSAITLAVAVRWLAVLLGANEADANVLALFTAPVGWTILTFLILMTTNRKRQFAFIAAAWASAIPAVITGQGIIGSAL